MESNLLSLSYGRIVRKDINDNEGLLPESFETYQIVEPDDVVWRLTDLQNDKRSLRTAIVQERGIITSAYLATTPRNIDPSYFHFLLRAYDHLKVFYSMGGGLRQAIKFGDIKRLPVLLPPESEQHLVASFLQRETSKIDDLIQQQILLTELIKEKRAAVVLRAVTRGVDADTALKQSGITWLGEVPSHWEIRSLSSLSRVVRGASPRPAGDPAYFDGEFIPWVTVGEITKDDAIYLDETEERLTELGAQHSRTFAAGTVLYTNSGATLGVPKICRVPVCANDGVVGFERLSGAVHPEYLVWFLRGLTDVIRDYVKQGSGQPNLNTEIVKAIRIPLPPRDEQQRILGALASMTSDWNRALSEVEKAIELLQHRRTALIISAATGAIDVASSVNPANEVRDAACAEIIRLCARKQAFGRVKMQKLVYLAEAHLGIHEINGTYAREAAGPLDRSLIRSLEQSLQDKGIISVHQHDGPGSLVTYAFTGTREIKATADGVLGSRCTPLRDLLKKIGDLDTLSVEAVATLYAVWNDALIDGEVVDEAEIIRRVLEEWHPEKPEKFNSEALGGWLEYMRRNSITPDGRGPRTHTPRLFP